MRLDLKQTEMSMSEERERAVDKVPPLPWTYEVNHTVGRHPGAGNVYLVDANGRKIAALYCSPEEKIALAEFLCAISEKAHTERQQR